VQQVRREADNCPPELERNADPAAEAARLMPEKLEFAPDLWRKRAEEARRLAELIEDNFTAETLVDIALQYDELAERAERRQRRRDWAASALERRIFRWWSISLFRQAGDPRRTRRVTLAEPLTFASGQHRRSDEDQRQMDGCLVTSAGC